MPAAIDLTNQHFGRLVVLERDFTRKGSGAYWKCQCECGNVISVIASSLKNGNTKSCGCLSKEVHSKIKVINEVGHKYGKLTVLERDKDKNTEKVYWICQCECGNKISVLGTSLRNGATQSCGCILSKGEEKIAQILRENNVQFEQQKTFKTCIFPDTNALAKFDFYLPKQNILIEYDGIGHFQSVANWDFIKQKEHDEYKNQWCEKNNIKLIRIPYYDFDIIDMLYINKMIETENNF